MKATCRALALAALIAPAAAYATKVPIPIEGATLNISAQFQTEFLVNQLIEPDVTSAPEFAAYVAHEREETGALLRRFNILKIQ